VILDEPTAALDPIAENEMYLKFGQAVEGRTCVYISHRLSSTRFCDRICLLEGGRIIEEGTHDDLMERKGRYARIYEIQSQYYRQRDERKRAGGAMGDAPSRQEEREELFYEQRGH
jgi:ABC-type bacteriocin/lantibiotic exporters, contain an N-terminal double-glycine peptidase domain